MRKGWKITAQGLFATSAIGILTALPGTGYSGTKPQTVETNKQENPQFRTECEGLQTALQIQLEFFADTTVSATDISTRFQSGKIVLKGNTNQKGIAAKARLIAEKFSTLPIKDEVRVWPIPSSSPQKASLETLQKGAEKATNLDLAALYPKLKVQAHNDGTLTVRGPIVSLEDKVEVSKKLRKIPGCLKVENLLEVQPMVHGSRTIQLVSKDGQKYLPVATKPPTGGMTALPESWPVFQSVKTEKPLPTVPTTGVVAVQSVEKTVKKETEQFPSQPKELPGSLNIISKPPEKTEPKTPSLPLIAPVETAKPTTLPEFPKVIASPASIPATKPTQISPVLPPVTPAPSPPTLKFSPKVDATPTTTGKSNGQVFQTVPSSITTQFEKPNPSAKVIQKTEPKPVDQKPTAQTTQASTKTWSPAHDPKGSATVRADALGYPPIRKEIPQALPRLKDMEKIPAQYLTASDKNPTYDRPYLVANVTTQLPSAKAVPLANPAMVATTQPTLLDTTKPASLVAKPTFPKVESKPVPTQKTPVVEQNSQPKVKAKLVSTKKEQEPKVGTGTISFDDEEEAITTGIKPNSHYESLRKLVLSSCKGEVQEVTVTSQANGKALVTVKMIQGKPSGNVARKLFTMPEFSTDRIVLELKD